MNVFTLLTPVTYWILILIWSFILFFYIRRLMSDHIKDQLISVLLMILAVDAFRTLFESVYFGAWYTSLAGFLPKQVHTILVRPELVFIPKILNVAAAVIVVFLLLFKWLPREAMEKNNQKKQIETSKTKLMQSYNDLKKSEEDLKESQRIAHIGNWRLDLASNRVVWSEELYKMYGFDPALPPPPYPEH